MTTRVTLGTDTFNTSGDGYDFAASPEIVTVLSDVTIYSQNGDGVYSGESGSSLVNKGNILSPNEYGVRFEGSDGSVTNQAGALVTGYFAGVQMDGAGKQVVTNAGEIIDTWSVAISDGVFFDVAAQGVAFDNSGSILSAGVGVGNNSSSAGGTFDNSGYIDGDVDGININTSDSLTTDIDNTSTGKIRGGADAIEMVSGRLSLDNAGKIVGAIDDQANVHDVIVNSGVIRGTVNLGGGNDLFNGADGRSGPVFGGDGNDRLIGGSGNDQLHGGAGNDTLTGGGGADRFYFDTALDASTNVDTITDFTPGVDKIVLSESVFSGLGPLGALAPAHFHVGRPGHTSPEIIYTPSTGALSYFANPHAPGGMTEFAKIAAGLTLHSTDFVVVA
jgi:Ca2+-binding RTX toxin-like protein